MQKHGGQRRPHRHVLGVNLRVGEKGFVRGLNRSLQGNGKVRLAISGGMELVNNLFGEVFNT
jgi:hypothetical protein